jgi:hypothetical protein
MFRIATRLPLRAARTPFVRYNSSTTGASRIVQLAGQVERPSAIEASVPVMWAVCGALVFTAFNRVEERAGSENVETVSCICAFSGEFLADET